MAASTDLPQRTVRSNSLSKKTSSMFLRISQNRWFSSQVRLEGKADFSPSLAHNTLKVVKSTTDLSVTASIIKTTEELNLACCMSTK